MWSSDPPGYFPATGQSSRKVTRSWSHPERDKAWPVLQVKARLKARKHSGQIPGDRIRHSPSLGSDQEGAELPGWWQWCHSRVPCVTLCGPDSACSGEGAGRGFRGRFPGTAGLPEGVSGVLHRDGGCPLPALIALPTLHQAHGMLAVAVPVDRGSSPQFLLCSGKRWDSAPNS